MVTNNKTIQRIELGDSIDLLELIIINREENLSKYRRKNNPSEFFINNELKLIENLKSILEVFSKLKHLNTWVEAEQQMDECEKSDPSLSYHLIAIHLNSRSENHSFLDLYADDYV